ncbi:MAG: HAMP domain-containing sensor histidine kinase [Planctomycetota bacterium]
MTEDALPPAVQEQLVRGGARVAWLRLDGGVVGDLGGDLSAYGLKGVVARGAPLPERVEWASALDGPLPLRLASVAAPRAEVERFDVEAREADGAVWVTLRDSSLAARTAGASMQVENDQDFLRDRLAGAERLRRGERRAREQVLRALGFELLERGPDGGYRPSGEPTSWLRDLCGWGPGEPRVLHPSDPTDFLTGFLEDAEDFFADASGDDEPTRRAHDGSRHLPSGVWTEAHMDADGETYERSFEATAIGLPGGRGVVAIERLDLSAALRQQALQRQRDAQLSYEGLAREVQVKDVLLHCIVHDLRGPLAGIVGSLSLLERGGLDDAAQDELVEMGLRQARRQEEMIGNVLDVFAAEYEALVRFEASPDGAPDVVAIAHETARRQRPAFEVAGARLVLEAPPGPILVVGRADRLERVLANLVGNALRHAPSGTDVTLRVEATDDGVRVSVLDRGPGVAAPLRERLFQRFVQGEGAGAVGLGLFYVRMTVERWGGSVAYADRDGGGADFRVDLVRATAEGIHDASP